ncbi:MAG: hypothetical protein IKI78_01525 [Clostridia bacterium]|nr:hypothetical protein [Clostridia bacterium]
MPALYIILGIILFFVLILSVKVKVTVHSENGVSLSVGWLFLKFNILPKHEKPEKKKKKKKPKKKKEDKPGTHEEKKDEKIKEPKENPFITFYHNNGVEGVVDLVKQLSISLGGMFRRIYRSFTIEDLAISLLVAGGDSADTALKYGRTCSVFFPAIGFVVDTMRVRKYTVEANPDFAFGKNEAKLHAVISVIPRRLINAVIIVGFSLIIKVGIRFLKGLKKSPKAEIKEKSINQVNEAAAAVTEN